MGFDRVEPYASTYQDAGGKLRQAMALGHGQCRALVA
jgi:hypothetical protein